MIYLDHMLLLKYVSTEKVYCKHKKVVILSVNVNYEEVCCCSIEPMAAFNSFIEGSIYCNWIFVPIPVLVTEYREAFRCFDLNENGTLSTKELKYAMRMLGSNPTDSQVQDLVNAKDFDGKKCACSALWFLTITYLEPTLFQSAVTERATLLEKAENPSSSLIARMRLRSITASGHAERG